MSQWDPKGLLDEPKRAAGQALVAACEDLLGVEGPAALARASRRSKAWWCKLRSGKGGELPPWSEMEQEILLPDCPPDVRGALKLRHRVAWLLLHDPDFLAEERLQALPELPLEHFEATQRLAHQALLRGDFPDALRSLKLLRGLLTAAGTEPLPRDRSKLLATCLCDLSACTRQMGAPDPAIHHAEEAATRFRQLGEAGGEAAAWMELGLAYLETSRCAEALGLFHRARSQFHQLQMQAEAVAAGRHAAAALLRLGRVEEAEQQFLRLLLEANGPRPACRYPILLHLAEACLCRRDVERACHWLENADSLAEQHPQELADHLLPHLIRRQRAHLEQALTAARRQRSA